MGRRNRRRAGPTLRIPERLIAALPTTDAEAIAAAVAKLNRGLTRQGPAFTHNGQYLRDTALRRAYGSYYLCANAPKLWPILDRVARWLPAAPRILELGGGPGTGVAAVGLWPGWSQPPILVSTDGLSENVAMARRLARLLDLDVQTGVARIGNALPSQLPMRPPYDAVLMMNVINELPTEDDPTLIRHVGACLPDDGLLIVIEPAAQEASRRTLEFRDALVEAGWSIPLPCPHNAPCPAFLNPKDWCHDEWPFERPDFMTQVDILVGTRREVLKATWFVATRRPVPRSPNLVRVVGARRDQKGRTRLPICTADGQRTTLEGQRRDRTEANAALAQASRFDLLDVRNYQTAGDARRVGPDGACHRIDETSASN